jgi:hypothetical protein
LAVRSMSFSEFEIYITSYGSNVGNLYLGGWSYCINARIDLYPSYTSMFHKWTVRSKYT